METTESKCLSQASNIPCETSDKPNSDERSQLNNGSSNCDTNLSECKKVSEEHSSEVEASDDEAFTDANAVPENVDYDEEHLKELYDGLSLEQREVHKGQSTDLKNKGNEEYKNRNFKEAITLYTQALNSCPIEFTSERSILYANRAAAYVSLEKNESAVADCNKALDLNPEYLKARVRRAQLHRKMDNLEQSLEDYKKILEADKDNREARQACSTLPQEINDRNEKLKAEMLGKLKDLGNLVLRPFGLSTDNFKVQQDPKSGGYSINFQNNPQ